MSGLDFSGISLGFGIMDVVSGAVSLLGLVNEYVIFGLAFVVVGMLIGLVVMAVRKGKSAASSK